MWVLVFFDLPTETKLHRIAHSKFRKNLLKDGFEMFQFSIYIRHCITYETSEVHNKRVISFLPEEGRIGILRITDKQFGQMLIFDGVKKSSLPDISQQLEFF